MPGHRPKDASDMKVIRPADVYDKATGEFKTVMVALSIDMRLLSRLIAAKAHKSKRGKSHALFGAITGEIINE